MSPGSTGDSGYISIVRNIVRMEGGGGGGGLTSGSRILRSPTSVSELLRWDSGSKPVAGIAVGVGRSSNISNSYFDVDLDENSS